jgi:RND family efflux transporter MFP subunit
MPTKPGARICTLLPLVALSALAALTGCHKTHEQAQNDEAEMQTVPVQVRAAHSEPEQTTEEVVGTVRAKLHATLEARLSGRIDKMPILLGQSIKAGQLVARLDAGEIRARLEQAQAALEQAEREWSRVSALFDSKTTTRAEYDAADAHRRVAKAAVTEAEVMMGYADVLAPFDGVVTRKWADRGDLAAPGKPLVDIEDPTELQLEADVPEAIASMISQGAQLSVRADSLDRNVLGTVSEIAPAADPNSRTFRVKLDLPTSVERATNSQSGVSQQAQHGLRSGQFARLVVPIRERPSLRIPASAVLQRGQMEIAFVVANQRAQLRLVKTGKHSGGGDIEILSGLDPGELVVVGGGDLLKDGQSVQVK